MKTLRLLGAALVLALSLSFPAYGDTDPADIHTPGRTGCAPGVQCTIVNPTGDSSTGETDSGFPTITDILWSLVSIY